MKLRLWTAAACGHCVRFGSTCMHLHAIRPFPCNRGRETELVARSSVASFTQCVCKCEFRAFCTRRNAGGSRWRLARDCTGFACDFSFRMLLCAKYAFASVACDILSAGCCRRRLVFNPVCSLPQRDPVGERLTSFGDCRWTHHWHAMHQSWRSAITKTKDVCVCVPALRCVLISKFRQHPTSTGNRSHLSRRTRIPHNVEAGRLPPPRTRTRRARPGAPPMHPPGSFRIDPLDHGRRRS